MHIAATVSGHATLSEDVLVSASTTSESLNISSATSTLFGATANVAVDVTWNSRIPKKFSAR